MEFVDGQSLDYKIRKISGPIPFIHARDLMIKMLEGFSHAHNAGVIHRDIKPANILISDTGDLKITDFGISKITSGEDRTTANIKLGTLCYMSPEQLLTADVDEKSDIYSLGMTFYEMLAGTIPFTREVRENPGSLTLRISNSEPFPLPTVYYPHIPVRIVEIVMRMLEKDVNKRYASLQEVLKELSQFDLSAPERTVMEEYEKTVAFDPTILKEGKRSDSESSSNSSPSSATGKEKKLKEMTWEEKQEKARLLEAQFREKIRLEEEERQRKIEEENRRREGERIRAEEERQRLEAEERAERERITKEKEKYRLELEEKQELQDAKLMKIATITIVLLTAVALLFLGYKLINIQIKIAEATSTTANTTFNEVPTVLPEMVSIEGGTFTMGSTDGNSDEKPMHQVTVSSFMMSKTEVTQSLWESVMGSNPSNFKWNERPVESVSWYDAVEFCNKLSEKEGLQKAYSGSGENISCDFTANGYRLPTEAEWVYAARGGNKSRGYKYAGSNDLDAVGWYGNNSGSETKESSKKQPNELGIFDMSGNVWEWCWDWYDQNYYSSTNQTDPRGPNSSSNRVLRGGSWYDDAEYCRVARRSSSAPDR
ncbi:MAG: hypothetical protein EDM75_01850, partial [Chlorobiota bacterium]